jgi:hypothetical protein
MAAGWWRGQGVHEYRFDCVDYRGQVTLSCKLHAASDRDASEIASDLLRETQCHAVEAWHQTRLVYRSVRPA